MEVFYGKGEVMGPNPLDQQKAILNQRLASSAGGALPGGQPPQPGMMPPPVGGQNPMGGAPTATAGTPGFQESLNSVADTLMRGNPADLEVFGTFLGQIVSIYQDHEQGQGAMPTPMTQGIPAQPTP